jgi:hypothetical protein
MNIRILITAACIATAGLTLPHPAAAQGVIIDEGGIEVAPPYDRDRGYDGRPERYDDYDRGVGPREARRIARRAGMVDVYDMDRRGRVWVVRGEDHRGRGMRITISVRSGEVIDIRRAGRG